MKIILSFFIVCLIAFPAFAEPIMTLEELEKTIGIEIESTDAKDLKTILSSFDELLKPYDQYRTKLLNSLAQKGESKWIEAYFSAKENAPVLHNLSYDELLTLKNDINLAIWLSDEWQEVTVPQGTWKVGEDIPAGHWTVKCHSGTWSTVIEWGEHLDDNNESISYRGRYSKYNTIYNPNNETFDPINDVSEYSFVVQDGDYIVIQRGAAVFMPYVGKPSFVFK